MRVKNIEVCQLLYQTIGYHYCQTQTQQSYKNEVEKEVVNQVKNLAEIIINDYNSDVSYEFLNHQPIVTVGNYQDILMKYQGKEEVPFPHEMKYYVETPNENLSIIHFYIEFDEQYADNAMLWKLSL